MFIRVIYISMICFSIIMLGRSLYAQANASDTLLYKAEQLLSTQPSLALEYAIKVKEHYPINGEKTILQKALKLEADALQYLGRYDEADTIYADLLTNISSKEQTPFQSEVLKEKGNVNGYLGRYELALQYYLKSLALKKAMLDKTGIAKLSNNIGLIYFRLGDDDKAMSYYQEVLNIAEEIDAPVLASTQVNMGFIYSRQGAHNKALTYHQKAFETYQSLEDNMRWANMYINIGLEYEHLGNYEIAISQYQSAYNKAIQHGHKAIYIDALNKLSKVYIQIEDFSKAIESLEEAYPLAVDMNDLALINELHLNLSNYYAATGNDREALVFHKKWTTLKDSLVNQNNRNRIAELELMYKTAEQENEIKLLEQKHARQRLFSVFSLILIASLIAIGLLIWSRYKMRIHLLQKESALQTQENRRKQLENEKLKVEKALKNEAYRRLENELMLKNSELSTVAMLIYQKNETLSSIKEGIKKILQQKNVEKQDIVVLQKQLQSHIRLDEDWMEFKRHFEQVHPHFFEYLQQQHPELTQADHRHCAYIKMKLTTKEIARLLNITPSSVQRSRVRLKKKLGLTQEEALYDYIIAINPTVN
jgi:tetratricopeptide (TPR) repeat protein